MTIIRIYKTDPYKGLSDYGTVDFIFDEDDEYAALEDYGSEPYASDLIREETEYDHVDHSAEIVTLEDMREMKEELEEEISELEEKRDTIDDALKAAGAKNSSGPVDYDDPVNAAEGIGR